MNKILVDGDKYLFESNVHDILVKGNAILYINTDYDIDLNITLEDDASLKVFDFNNKKKSTKINIIQNNRTTIDYFHTFIIDDDYKFDYYSSIIGNDNNNNLTINGVSNGTATIDADAFVNEVTNGNVISENIKILTIEGKAYISPMLHINTLNVIANHNTAISNIRNDELFYLKSKGIDEEHAKNLIIDGFIYGTLKNKNEEFLNIIKE